MAFPRLLHFRYGFRLPESIFPRSPPSSLAGLFSGLVSHTVSAKILYPRFLSYLAKEATVRSSPAASALVGDVAQQAPKRVLPSLGASGAIYATVTLTALAFPDAQVQPIFVPISVSITTGVGALVLADIVGVLRGWK